MESRSRYFELLGPLLDRPLFTAAEARALGVPAHALGYLVGVGLLERVARGVYVSSSYVPEVDLPLEGLAMAAASVPNGVICLISALAYWELTDEVAREHWLAIPHDQRAPVRRGLRVVRTRQYDLGRQSVRIGEYELLIYDRERCVVDAFRYLSSEIAIKALRAYLAGRGFQPHLRTLTEYAKILRVNLSPYVLSLTT